jgi:hypothetical protein
MSAAVDRFVELASDLLKRWVDGGMGDVNLLRQAAVHYVDLRQLHRSPDGDGQADWQGRSRAYKAEIAKINAASGIPEDRRKGLTNRMVYHVGVELRKRLSPEELEAAGIRVTSYHRQRYKARLEQKRAADPVVQIVEFAALVDELYKPEGRIVWWRNFAQRDEAGRQRMIRGLIGVADGVFV